MGSLDTGYTTLGPLDHLPPRHYTRFVLYLPLKPEIAPIDAFNDLQQGLHKTFLQLPWLNGKVHWQSRTRPGWKPGQLELRHRPLNESGPRPEQFKFNDLGSSISYSELKASGFPMDTFGDVQLLWAPFAPDMDKGADAFVAQGNFLPGGCLLSTALFHSAADGMATMTMIKLWGDNCRNLKSQGGSSSFEVTVPPPDNFDRAVLDSLWSSKRARKPLDQIDPSSWQILGLNHPSAETSEKHQKNADAAPASTSDRVLKSHIFYIPPAKFNALKRSCAKELDSNQISGNDAICALIWRGLAKSRVAMRTSVGETTPDSEARLEMTFDGRSYFSLPPTYLGNVVLISKTTLPVSTLTAPDTTIPSISKSIRHSVNEIHPESVFDAYTLARGMPDFGRFDQRANPIGGWEMLLTSLLAMPASTLSFGDDIFGNGGKVESIRPMMGEFNKYLRICFIMPPKPHGGVEVVCGLFDEELEFLSTDKEFGKYAMLLF